MFYEKIRKITSKFSKAADLVNFLPICLPGDNLPDETIEISVWRALDVQIPFADVVDGLIVHHEGAVRMFQGGVGRQDGIVRLNNRRRHLKRIKN